MTRYAEILEELKTTTTKAGLEFARCGVTVSRRDFRSLTDEEAEELYKIIDAKLQAIAE
ncbi:MAG: hypothetical protein J6S50_05595 [Oscillospiraceae bacterium]|nr:hypothetical protein [Lachnospiraceae bacterium]MBO7727970.1 hypothetical protein [Oscillospiraceae bacterium]